MDLDSYHFASLDHDTESGTEHASFRQYNNAQGRWMAPDPYGGSYDFSNPQSLNRYAYALNNPVSLVDPTGLYCFYGGSGDNVDDDPDKSDYVALSGV